MQALNFSKFPTLTTDRLTLRKINHDDIIEIFELRSDDSVNKFLARKKAASPEDAKTFINNTMGWIAKNESIIWAISLKNQPHLIGTICLWNISIEKETAEIGYELLPRFHGKGYMQEAFEKVVEYGFDEMKLAAIEACTVPENLRSIRVLEKNEFKFIGNLKNGDGSETGEVIYSLQNKNK